MATKLYFHAASSSVSGTLPSTEQSSLTAHRTFDAVTVNRSMNTTIGAGQTTLTHSTTVASSDNFFISKWVSDTLDVNQTISANTWDYNLSTSQSSTALNWPVATSGAIRVVCYVWRPGTGALVGTICDSNSGGTSITEPGTNSQRSHIPTFSGSSVSALAGDVIVFEAWVASLSGNNSGSRRYMFDGTTETLTNNTVVSDHASFIQTPQNLTFSSGLRNLNALSSDSLAFSSDHPRSRLLLQTRTDAVAFTDVANRYQILNKISSDTLTLIQTSTVRIKGKVATLSNETVNFVHSNNRLRNLIRLPTTDNLSMIGTTNRFRLLIQICSHSLALTESGFARMRMKIGVFVNSLSFLGVVGSLRYLLCVFSDSLSTLASNHVYDIIGRIRGFTNSLTLNHVGTRLQGKIKALDSEGFSITSSVISVAAIIRSYTESLTIVKAIGRQRNKISQIPAEAITLSHYQTDRLTSRLRGFTNVLTLNADDNVTYLKLKLAGFVNMLTITSSLNTLTTRMRNISHTLSFTDASYIRIKTISARLISDSMTLSKQIQDLRLLLRGTTAQSVALNDSSYSRLRNKIRIAPDQVLTFTLSSVINFKTKIREIFAQSLSFVAEHETSVGLKMKNFANNISLSLNSITKSRTKIRDNTDNITFDTPVLLRTKNIFRGFSNAVLSLTDLADQMKLLLKSFSDTTGSFNSEVTRLRGKIVTTSNSISLTKFINRLRINFGRYFSAGIGPLSSVAVKSKVLSRAFTTASLLLTSNFVNERGMKIKGFVENLVLVASNPVRLTNRIKSTFTQTLALTDITDRLSARFKGVIGGNNVNFDSIISQLKEIKNRSFTDSFSLVASAPITITTRFKKFTEHVSLNSVVLRRLTKLPTSEEISEPFIEKLREPELLSDAQRPSHLFNKIVVRNMHPYIKKDQINLSKPDKIAEPSVPSKTSGEMSNDSNKVMDRIRKGINKYF